MIESLTIGLDMTFKHAKAQILILCGFIICFLSSCYHPPFNNFKPDHSISRRVAAGATTGSITGAVASTTVGGTLIGGAAGGVVGAAIGMHHESKGKLIKDLQKQDIQYVSYGDTMTLVVPTDKYFMFNSPRLNEVCYPGLVNIIKLIKLYPNTPIYVAGFTDNVGSLRHKKRLSQSQAETMLSFLWANGIKSGRLKAQGYGDKNDIADNELIHGSAQNRRIEIQWFTHYVEQPDLAYMTK